ncbi:MAG: NADH/ubiquinone/plastoquinone (complex I), partial [Candidatus Limnocylindria bacterium]
MPGAAAARLGWRGVMGAGTLLVATLAVPVGMLAACLSRRVRDRMPALLGLAPVPALAAALLASGGPPLVLDQARLQFTLALDPPGAMLLGVAALLWSASGIYARTWLEGQPNGGRFAVWWLLSLTGSLGVFFAADMASFYVVFGLASLAACGLVVHDGTPFAQRATAIYLALAVLGELCLLMAFALLAAATPGDSLAIGDAVATLPTSPWRNLTLALLIAGFGLKIGL